LKALSPLRRSASRREKDVFGVEEKGVLFSDRARRQARKDGRRSRNDTALATAPATATNDATCLKRRGLKKEKRRGFKRI
jgi:hypothetical protein